MSLSEIVLNEERSTQLEAKRQEYVGRVQRLSAALETKPNDVTVRVKMLILQVRTIVLGTLLRDGRVDTAACFVAVQQRLEGVSAETYESVCRLIATYNNGDTSTLVGGTGLPKVSQAV